MITNTLYTYLLTLNRIYIHDSHATIFHQIPKYEIKNALVVILGIGDYDNSILDLIGVPRDYKNILWVFYNLFSYSVIFWDENNHLQYCSKFASSKNESNNLPNKAKLHHDAIHPKKLHKDDGKFKIKWTCDEIDEYFDQVSNIVSKGEHDSLICFMSSHGDVDGVIVDSDEKEYQLFQIFNRFFGQNCKAMISKPKIFFADTCRGRLRSKIKIKNQTQNKKRKNQDSVDINIGTRCMPSDLYDHKEKSVASAGMEAHEEKISAKTNTNLQRTTPTPTQQSHSHTRMSDLFHEQENCRFIYPNPEGYASLDGGKKGGYLIQSTKKVFSKTDIENKNLDEIVLQIRLKTREMAGAASIQLVEDVNLMTFPVCFVKKK